MGELPRWASRFQFTRELWSDADRLLLDPALERALASGRLAAGEGPIFAELADALLPQDGSGRRTWFLAERGRRVAEYARQRSGAVFADLRESIQLITDERWRFAQCDLTGLLAEEEAGLTASLEERVSPIVGALLETLSEYAEEGRQVAISVPTHAAMGGRGVTEQVFFDYLAENFPSARVYGLADAPAVGVFDFGPVTEDSEEQEDGAAFEREDDDATQTQSYPGRGPVDYESAEASYDSELDEAEKKWSVEETQPDLSVSTEEEDDEEGGIPIDYDNSLGELDPRYFSYLAIVGTGPLPDGLTLIELSTDTTQADGSLRGGESPAESSVDASGLRAQLAEAQRQAELLAVERQSLLERLDEAEERIGELEDEREGQPGADDDRDHHSVSGEFEVDGPLSPEQMVGRLDAALAREQELRWRLQSVSADLEAAVARPVAELEAEVAHLRARLEAGQAEMSADELPAPDLGTAPASLVAKEGASVVLVSLGADMASLAKLRAELDALLRKVERGGLNGVELHRALRQLRAGLGRL